MLRDPSAILQQLVYHLHFGKIRSELYSGRYKAIVRDMRMKHNILRNINDLATMQAGSVLSKVFGFASFICLYT